MPDAKVSTLPLATAVADTDLVPVIVGGVSSRATVQRVNRKLSNVSIAAQTPTIATLAYLTGSDLTIPTATTIGTTTQFQWKIVMTKTATGTAARTFHIRAGTAGTTADAALITFTTAAGTAVADTARVDILLTVRTIGATGTLVGSLTMTHSLAATGFLNIPAQTIAVLSGAFNTTTANLKFGISFQSGAAESVSFSQVSAEVVNI